MTDTHTDNFATRVEGINRSMVSPSSDNGINTNVGRATHSHSHSAAADEDPFAAQRTEDNDPFRERSDSVGGVSSSGPGGSLLGSSPPNQSHQGSTGGYSPTGGNNDNVKRDRRMSKEWDASKVPPSRFQKREGSIYATPSSRDGHVDRNTNVAFTEKLKQKGWL